MAAACETLNGYLQHADPCSNSERSTDSPLPLSEDDSVGPLPPPDPEWTEERFRVDRKKLEIMLLAASEGRSNGGEHFFQKVMDETNTQIAWPSKLKIGAKSKKDPHIKICGKRDSVKEAKERIMPVLDTKSNRVTLKMDVSHTEHSYVIGKGGNNIKKVMQETGCHIHFPDSNRNNQAEKSNQVSIAGQPAGVEAARVKIRELLPLVLMFELPALVQADPSSATVQQLCQTYSFTVSFKPPSRLYGATGVVRGSQNNASAVQKGTALLLEHLVSSLASAVVVSTQLDIAPQHHLFMMGRNGSNIKHISQRTGAQIHFPDPSTPHTHRKSTIYIQGSVDAVCLARQHLMGCLPLVLIFDVKEGVEPQCVSALMEQLDVFISIKPKPRQPSKSVIVKSVERNAGSMYEARKILLGLENGDTTSSSISGHSPSSNDHASLPTLLCPVGLDIFASAGLGLSTLGFSSAMMLHPVSQASLTSMLLSGVQAYTQGTPSPPPGLIPIHKPTGGPTADGHLNGHVKHPGSVYSHKSSASLADVVLSPARCDPASQPNTNNPAETLSRKSSSDEGSDTFVEVGMPRSPSHSANGNDLKQMLASCKSSSGKRQTVELLQGTKNSHLHSDCLLSDSDSSASESPLADKRAPGSERAAERAAQQNCERIRLAPQSATYANMQYRAQEQFRL